MLLSCKKPCAASTERNEFEAANLTDENVRSFWVAGTNSAGQWATIDLLREYDVEAFQVNYTDYQSDIFGDGSGAPPATPANLRVERHPDARDATLRWEAVPDAVGYNILWGIVRDNLYQTYQVWADAGQTLELRALNLGQDYYFAIEAFNENGVSKPGGVVYVK